VNLALSRSQEADARFAAEEDGWMLLRLALCVLLTCRAAPHEAEPVFGHLGWIVFGRDV
jgi:hypothetical protein